jgi:Protein of unknown function (DUF1592)/Protein of unknown function (DUF1588)/Protein of unknown function (DUF1595)/Protein of unknown function (DUF1585)
MLSFVRSQLTSWARHPFAWGVPCLALGCTGEVAGQLSGGVAGATSVTPPSANGGMAPVAEACESAAPPARRITLRSELHYVSGLRSLFGAGVLVSVSGVPDPRARTLDLDLVNKMSAKSLATRFELTEAVGDKLAAAPQLLACTSGEQPRDCARRVTQSLVERAFRRAAETAEVDELLQLYDAAAVGGHEAGMRALAEAIAFAPSTMYTRELGAEQEPGKFALSSWEVADLLGLFFLESVPDEPLLQAARSDALKDEAAIGVQVVRLLALPEVRQNLSQTLLSFLQAPRIFDTVKDPKFGDFESLKPAMFQETSMVLDQLSWNQPAPIAELLTSNHSFVNPALAALYGVPYPGAAGQTDFLPVELPAAQRAGILTQAGLLSIKAAPNTTSIIFRGLFVRGALLCLPDIPLPTDPATQSKINELTSNATLSEREKAEVRRTTSPCNGCHAQFDPFGLALENYDSIGRYRAAYDSGTPIDSSLDATAFAPALQGKIQNAVELAKQVAASGRFQTCLASRLLAYAANTPLEAQNCDVQAAVNRARANGDTIGELARAIAVSPLLRVRSASIPGGLP